jgi:hypothetical protein
MIECFKRRESRTALRKNSVFMRTGSVLIGVYCKYFELNIVDNQLLMRCSLVGVCPCAGLCLPEQAHGVDQSGWRWRRRAAGVR